MDERVALAIDSELKVHCFVKRLLNDLQAAGISCRLDDHDCKIGDRSRSRIDEAIRLHARTILVLSTLSIASEWFRKETDAAHRQEDREGRNARPPIRLGGGPRRRTRMGRRGLPQSPHRRLPGLEPESG